MQLTRFDRWLREKFVYETQISTLSPAQQLPRGIRIIKSRETTSLRYKYLYITSSNKAAGNFLAQLKENNQMYATQVVDKKAWYVPLIAPDGKSFTWRIFSTIVLIIFSAFCVLIVYNLLSNEQFKANLLDALRLFKNGY
jgi:hypothetical protein